MVRSPDATRQEAREAFGEYTVIAAERCTGERNPLKDRKNSGQGDIISII